MVPRGGIEQLIKSITYNIYALLPYITPYIKPILSPPLTHRGAHCYIYPQGLVLPRLTLIVNVTIHIKSGLEKSVKKILIQLS